MSPLFSIVTASRNSLAHLQKSYESIAAQNPARFEFLVIDGASTDGTPAWLHQLGPEKCRWISEPDSGVYEAMNKGIGMAEGQFLYFLGAGDLLLPGVLEDAAQYFAKLPETLPRFVYGNVRMRAQAGRIVRGPFPPHRLAHFNICHQAIFYDRRVFARLGGFDLKYPVLADWAYNLRCFGDPQIAKFYWDHVIADFAEGGLSDRMRDFPFAHDRHDLIFNHLGRFAEFRYRWETRLWRKFPWLPRPTA